MKHIVGLLVVLVALAACGARAEAQQTKKVPRIGILPPGPISERVHLWDAFRQGLREQGYVEGQNIILVFPSTEVKPERLPHLAAELVSLKVDVIVAATTVAAQAAKEASKTIPIVMPVAGDPVGTGLVASLARPGGNVTGLTTIASDLSGKRLELLKEVVPRVSRIAVLLNPSSANGPPQVQRDSQMTLLMRETEVTARALGVQLQRLEVRGPDDFERLFQAATKERAGALITLDDAFLFSQRTRIVKLAAKSRLPAIYFFREFVEDGGAYVLRGQPRRHVPARRNLRGQNPQRRQACRSAGRATDEVRVHYQSEGGEADRPDDSAKRTGAGG